jgi:hypothetical protein
VETDADIRCTAILARNSGNDGEIKRPFHMPGKIRLLSPQIITANLYIRKIQT